MHLSIDRDCWLRIAQKYRSDFINGILALYRVHENAVSRDIDTRITCNNAVMSRHIRNNDAISLKIKNKSLAIYHANIGSLRILAGQYGSDIKEWVGPFPLKLPHCNLAILISFDMQKYSIEN